MKFQKIFTKYQFKNIGFVKLPKPYITNETKKSLGLKNNCSNQEILRKLCIAGYKEKIKSGEIKKEDSEIYGKRIKEELSILEELYFTDYVLLVWSIVEKARELGVFIDFGRGSCVSSACFWLLKITGCDPVKLKLFFSRFVNRARAKSIKDEDGNILLQNDLIADADINLGDGRDEIVKWLKEIYPNRVSQISTVGTYTSKIVLKDVYKAVEEVDESECQHIADLIEKKFGTLDSLEDTYLNNPIFKAWADEHKEVFELSCCLSNNIRQTGTHPSGWLISEDDLTENSPLQLDSEKQIVCSYTMEDVQAPKIDLLGLSTNKILKEVLANIPEKLSEMNLESDPIIYDQFQHDTLLPYGLYQISADCAYRVCNKLKPKNVVELSHVNSIARPGALAYEKPYIENSAECPHELFREALEWTKFLPLYQEQTIALAMAIGFTAEESEILRRIVGKKKLEDIKAWKEKIYNKTKENNLPEKLGDILWKVAEESAAYSFNYCIYEEEFVDAKIAGRVKLKTVEVGDEILAFDTKNNRNHWVKIKKIHKNQKQIFWSAAGTEDIATSKDHKFLTRGGMKKVEDCILEYNEVKTIDGWEKFVPMYSQVVKPNHVDWIFNTIDLEVDHEDHNFYCNGVCVSNSHSIATSYTGALTVYLKYKYPQQFYLACLKASRDKPNQLEEIALIEKELKYFSIKLLPPDLLKSDIDFKLEGPNIRFGLNSVRSISEKTFEKLRQFRGEFPNLFELCQSAKQCGLSIGNVSSLAMAGALDSYVTESRVKLTLITQLFNILTDKEKLFCIKNGNNYNYDLLKMLPTIEEWTGDNGKKISRKGRLLTVRRKSQKYQSIYKQNIQHSDLAAWIQEREMIGYSYSTNLKSIFNKNRKDILNLDEFKNLEKGEKALVIVQVDEIQHSKSKKGNKYIRLTVSDENVSNFRVLFCGRALEGYLADNKTIPGEKDILAVKLCKNDDNSSGFVENLAIQTEKVFWKMSQIKDSEISNSDNILPAETAPENPKNLQLSLNIGG